MFGYCGVTSDKIHFGVPVSKKQNMFSLRLIKMQCCVFVCVWGGGGEVGVGGGAWLRPGVYAWSMHGFVLLVVPQLPLPL